MNTSRPLKLGNESFSSLAGKTAIITGGSSGIGLETGEFLYELGCNVVFVGGRKTPRPNVPADSPRILITQCNLASWDSQVDAFEAAIANFGKIDIVVPNAGVAEPEGQYFNLGVDEKGRPKPLDMIAFEIDMKGTASTTALGIHYMKNGGSIIIMSSQAGYAGVPTLPSYSASKHGATGLVRSLTSPAKQRNISISLVGPSMTYSPGTFPTEYAPGEAAFQSMRKKLKQIGVGLSSSRTCAIAVAYLADGGLKTTGMGLLVDDDEIWNIEQALRDSRPKWWIEKSDNEKSAEAYAESQAKS